MEMAFFTALILFCVGSAVQSSLTCKPEKESCNGTVSYYVFDQQWPQTLCMHDNNENEDKCVIPDSIKTWTVHGLWPNSKSHSRCPAYCSPSSSFNETKVKPFLKNLESNWPNLFPATPNFSFWAHEWCKHGTCCSKDEHLNSEVKYFQFALDLHAKFNISQILADAKILPSETKSYDMTQVLKAFTAKLNKTPTFSCLFESYKLSSDGSKKKERQWLWEIGICLDLSFRPMDCPSTPSNGGEGECNMSMEVYYCPPNLKNKGPLCSI